LPHFCLIRIISRQTEKELQLRRALSGVWNLGEEAAIDAKNLQKMIKDLDNLPKDDKLTATMEQAAKAVRDIPS